MRVYFDHNATTPVDPAVVDADDARRCATTSATRRASTTSASGPRRVLDEARTAVATLIGAEPSEIVFTSGGTEADNFALRGAAEALEPTGRRHLIASAIEHEAVLDHAQGAGAARLDAPRCSRSTRPASSRRTRSRRRSPTRPRSSR